MKQSVTRLFDSFRPEHYELELTLNPSKKKFSGFVSIRGFKTGRPSRRLTFHAKDLVITKAIVHRVHTKGSKTDGAEIKIDRVNSHKSYDEVRLHSPEMLYPGEYHIVMEFNGNITDPMNGLYPCYFTHEGKKKFLLATQFESHHAREVFPCIDEPEAKATFDLALKTPKDGEVLANTPARSTIEEGSLRTTIFETTPVMSTYLLAFAFGDVGYKESRTTKGTIVRTYATPENVKFTDFALECAVKCLEYYEDYFDIAYPLEKCDLIGLPDFANGAMENWGLITFREQCLFVDPKNTSLGTKQFVAMVVAHELAHQWFGNLVTMRWWTDLWLNEGFASWVEYLAVDHMFPEWDMWIQFISSEQQPAMKLDALDNTHAIEVPVRHPDEIHSIFDTISYSKGASVIHMLHGYLGKDNFRDGLRHYLKQNAYKNTDTLDLWQALEEKSGQPVKEIMQAWTSQPGFPLVNVENKKGQMIIRQQRFYLQPPTVVRHDLWPIPILAENISLKRLDDKQAIIEVSEILTKINQSESGFYRTAYDKETLELFANQISSGKMNALDRLGILADSFEAAKAGMGSITVCLELLSAFTKEDNSAVWDIIAANLSEIRRAMDDKNLRELFKPFIIKLTSKELKRLGWEEKSDDSHFDRLLRPTILGLSSAADEANVVKEALDRFKYMKKSEDIPADVRSIVYSTAAHHGDESTFNTLLTIYKSTSSSEEKTTICAALTGFKQEELMIKALDFIKTKDVRKQDVMYWLAYALGNFYNKKLAWQWLKDNWRWLNSNLGHDLSFFRTPIYAARSFSDQAFLKDFTDFFKSHSTPALERSIKQGTEMINWQIGWKQRDLQAIQDYLQARTKQ